MRPRKVLLCVNADESELSVLKFTLSINGYRVLTATDGKEAIALFATAPVVDLVLVDFIRDMTPAVLIERLKRMRSFTPMILLGDPSTRLCMADIVIRKNCPGPELLERIKVMSARKRGPRKGSESAMRCGMREATAPASR